MQRKLMVAVLAVAAAAAITGCRVETDKHGDSENVKIATPFGGMHVKTDTEGVLASIGLPAYPGATLLKKDKDGKGNDGSADVDMSFGGFQLRVKAAGYHSSDKPDQVLAFYRKALTRFGNVIECQHNKPVGTPTVTDEGLGCDDDNRIKVKADIDIDAPLQLRAGSKRHQHIVEVEPDGSGTKLGLVALDLPGEFHFGKHDNKDGDGGIQ